MTGWQLSDEVRQRYPGLKVLVTTAYLRASSPWDSRHDHHVTLIAKPFSIAELAKKVRDLLSG
jgi:DNA-binding NtrC family response regulator